MVHFVNYWLDLRKADGMRAREVDYWLLGQPRTLSTPRWSVLRDVLHWRNGRNRRDRRGYRVVEPPAIWGRRNTSLSGPMGSKRASW